jgi:GcrA cell cycle regulator
MKVVYPVWHEDWVKILRDSWKKGASKKEIAAEIGNGITENAVGGKARRLNLGRHPNSREPVNTTLRLAQIARVVTSAASATKPREGSQKPSMPYIPPSRSAY